MSSKDNKQWLHQNESLRMDANDPYFNENRRNFHLQRYHFAASFCEGKNVLDGACGTGYGSNIIGDQAQSVTGIDISGDAISYANENYASKSVKFLKSSVEHTHFGESQFDSVVSFETVEHTLCPKSHMREITRLLKPSGTAILSVPNEWGLTDHHFFDFNFKMLKELLDPFFEDINYYAQFDDESMFSSTRGIEPISGDSSKKGQCILAVCRNPIKEELDEQERLNRIFDEIYQNSFQRHNQYRSLAYKYETPIFVRLKNKLLSIVGR